MRFITQIKGEVMLCQPLDKHFFGFGAVMMTLLYFGCGTVIFSGDAGHRLMAMRIFTVYAQARTPGA